MTFFFYTILTIFLLVCVILVLLVLIQKGRGGGLSGAFGGSGGSTAFGTKTGDVLTWATSILFGVFILLAVVLNLVTDKLPQTPGMSSAAVPTAPVAPPRQPIIPGQ
jgi:preprotein translocase subunit SecG